jgi:hypothetical protein
MASIFESIVNEQVVTPSVVVTLCASGVTPVTPPTLFCPLFHETVTSDPPLEHQNTCEVKKVVEILGQKDINV